MTQLADSELVRKDAEMLLEIILAEQQQEGLLDLGDTSHIQVWLDQTDQPAQVLQECLEVYNSLSNPRELLSD